MDTKEAIISYIKKALKDSDLEVSDCSNHFDTPGLHITNPSRNLIDVIKVRELLNDPDGEKILTILKVHKHSFPRYSEAEQALLKAVEKIKLDQLSMKDPNFFNKLDNKLAKVLDRSKKCKITLGLKDFILSNHKKVLTEIVPTYDTHVANFIYCFIDNDLTYIIFSRDLPALPGIKNPGKKSQHINLVKGVGFDILDPNLNENVLRYIVENGGL